MEIVNEILIPALDKVGADFESGKLFLPQLIQSATTAQEAFDVLKEYMSSQKDAEGKVFRFQNPLRPYPEPESESH